MKGLEERVESLDWASLLDELDEVGGSQSVHPILDPSECRALADLYDHETLFRATVDMAPRKYGSGQYRYFEYPLPGAIAQLRSMFYVKLLPVARDWAERLGRPAPWPDTLDEWLTMCHGAGQLRPTPLLLRYGPGDWNALHRDLYGELVFPLQVVIGLDEPAADYEGGEFLLVEQRARVQSRGTATMLRQGHVFVFTTSDRPVESARGWSVAPMRHGVSTVRSGERRTLGLVLHDAE
ncbi:2OG-Fe(II) oxygenase [Rhodococcus spongiicola]|uniref:Proline hydroxylase n=1 Tax=Rhodococcus spongiicola TaxID=2487352 RepID=A0A438AUT3_9NOCA|nr:2OG-Fe(II) oxygenase [Rhodococcus spongiicola]RVW02506.1 proline hydroxylase [Rhodococcus spongiicola]